MPTQLGVISRPGHAEARGKLPFSPPVDSRGRGGPRAEGVRGVRRRRGDFGSGPERVAGDVFRKQLFELAGTLPATTKAAGLEKSRIWPNRNENHRLISGPHERRLLRQPRLLETRGRATRPPRRRPGGFRLPPIRCKNCAKFLRLLCPPNNMSPLASNLFSVRPPFARRTTVDEDDDGRRRRRSADGEKEL